MSSPKKPVKVRVRYPMLSAPNDGYDENGLWCGKTPQQVKAWLKRLEQEAKFMSLKSPSNSVH